MIKEYFTERELGKKKLILETIDYNVYNGIINIFENYEKNLAKNYPAGNWKGISALDIPKFKAVLKSEIPDFNMNLYMIEEWEEVDTYPVLDFLEFCYSNIFSFIICEVDGYKYLNFTNNINDDKKVKDEFKEKINRVFERNQIIFYLDDDGKVKRRTPIGMEEIIKNINLKTCDYKLNELIINAIDNIKKPKLEDRKIGLEKIWDAFERMKTYYENKNKKSSLEQILIDVGQDTDNFYELLNSEFKELTKIGNQYQIRHFEKDKIEIKSAKHIDYLFYRMLNSINVCVSILK